MSTQKPPGGVPPKPRVHHPGGTGGAGTPAGQVGATAEGYTSVDYNNPAINDFLAKPPPSTIYYVGERPMPGSPEPTPQPIPPVPYEQVVQAIIAKVLLGLTTQPALFWPSMKALAQIRFVTDGIDPSAVQINLPYNSTQICDGGLSMIKAIQALGSKTDFLKVDPLDLGNSLAHVLNIRTGQEFVGWIGEVLACNESVYLNKISETINDALKLGGSLIAVDGDIDRLLEPAQAIRKQPAPTRRRPAPPMIA